jgi:hypothetical protein
VTECLSVDDPQIAGVWYRVKNADGTVIALFRDLAEAQRYVAWTTPPKEAE